MSRAIHIKHLKLQELLLLERVCDLKLLGEIGIQVVIYELGLAQEEPLRVLPTLSLVDEHLRVGFARDVQVLQASARDRQGYFLSKTVLQIVS